MAWPTELVTTEDGECEGVAIPRVRGRPGARAHRGDAARLGGVVASLGSGAVAAPLGIGAVAGRRRVVR